MDCIAYRLHNMVTRGAGVQQHDQYSWQRCLHLHAVDVEHAKVGGHKLEVDDMRRGPHAVAKQHRLHQLLSDDLQLTRTTVRRCSAACGHSPLVQLQLNAPQQSVMNPCCCVMRHLRCFLRATLKSRQRAIEERNTNWRKQQLVGCHLRQHLPCSAHSFHRRLVALLYMLMTTLWQREYN